MPQILEATFFLMYVVIHVFFFCGKCVEQRTPTVVLLFFAVIASAPTIFVFTAKKNTQWDNFLYSRLLQTKHLREGTIFFPDAFTAKKNYWMG